VYSMQDKDSIEFLARYKDWVSVKKISIDEGTRPEEIALHLASIRQSLDRKSFEILGIDIKGIDDYASSITKDMRKSYSSLAQVIQKLGTNDAKEVVKNACKGKDELAVIAETYLFRRVVQDLKFDFDVNPELLQSAYPSLKIPKPMGRKPKA
jgi:hypothetical protein